MAEIEAQLREMMDAAVAGSEPPPGFMERLRRRSRRRMVWAATTSAAGVAAVVVAVTVASILAGGARHNPGPATRTSPRAGGAPVSSWASRLHGEVAYACQGSVCLMRPDGTGERDLGGMFGQNEPAWSPNGQWLAVRRYYGPAEGDYGIYVVQADGCHLTKLAGAMNGSSPSWSPTGRQIAFAAGGIDVVNADGNGFRRLISDTARYGYDLPAWSASNRIAFVRTLAGTSLGEIYAMNADGSGVAPLTRGGPGFGQPSWSPDGTSIAFVAGTDSAGGPPRSSGVIEVARADGTGLHRVSPPSWTSYSPTWTPDGKIVFLAKRGTGASAYVVNPDGAGMRQLYPYPTLGDVSQIAWGPTSLPRAGC